MSGRACLHCGARSRPTPYVQVAEARALAILCACVHGPCTDCGKTLHVTDRVFRCSTCRPPALRLCSDCEGARHKHQALHEVQASTTLGGWEAYRPDGPRELRFPAGLVECSGCHSLDTVPSMVADVRLHVHTPVPREHLVTATVEATCQQCALVFRVPCAVYGCLAAPVPGVRQWYDIQSTALYRGLLLKGKTSIQGYTEALEHVSTRQELLSGPPDASVYKANKLTTGQHAGFSRVMQQHREVEKQLQQAPTGRPVFENCWCCEKRPDVETPGDHGVTICQDGSYSVGPRQLPRKALVSHSIDGMVADTEVAAAVAADNVQRGRPAPEDGRKGCTSHLKAIEGGHEVATSRYMASMDKTGTVFATCPHRCVKQSVVPMVTAERAVYFVLCLKKLTERGEQIKRVFCDIACVLKNVFREHGLGRYHPGRRVEGLWTCCSAPHAYQPDIGCCETQVLLPELHCCNHSLACQVRYSVLYEPTGGKESSEGSESKNFTKQGFGRLSQGWSGDQYLLEWQAIHSGDNREINGRMHTVLRDMWLLNERSYRRFDRALGAICQDIEAKTKRPVLFHDSLVLGEYLPRNCAICHGHVRDTSNRAGYAWPCACWSSAGGACRPAPRASRRSSAATQSISLGLPPPVRQPST